jgi:hypothetical protein
MDRRVKPGDDAHEGTMAGKEKPARNAVPSGFEKPYAERS